jgi:pimeloyl-ACP methyl ester carboxylesterase
VIDAEPITRRFDAHGLALNYVDWGNDGAPIVVLVHGGRDHARNWDAVARALRSDYHVVAPDLRGHGDSGWSPDGAYSGPFFVEDLAALVDHIGGGPVMIVAHSLGGAIALRYAALFPEKLSRIAAIEGIGLTAAYKAEPVETKWRNFVEDRRRIGARPARTYPTIETAQARMQAENPRLSPEQAHHLTVHGVREQADGSFGWKFDPFLRARYPVDIDNDDQRRLWRQIVCPAWLVHGGESWADHPDLDGRAAEFRDARVTSYEGAGHWVHHDRTEAFIADLLAFLREGR